MGSLQALPTILNYTLDMDEYGIEIFQYEGAFNMKFLIFDIESYPDFFSLCLKEYKNENLKIEVTSDNIARITKSDQLTRSKVNGVHWVQHQRL